MPGIFLTTFIWFAPNEGLFFVYTWSDLVLSELFAHIVALNAQYAGGSTDLAVNGSSGNGTVNLTMGFAVLAVSGFIIFRRDKRLQSTPERAIALMIQGELAVVNSLYNNIAGKYWFLTVFVVAI